MQIKGKKVGWSKYSLEPGCVQHISCQNADMIIQNIAYKGNKHV